MNLAPSPWQQADIIRHSLRLINSYQHWTGQELCAAVSEPATIAYELFHASFALLSHGMEADPILNYGNQQALAAWEMSWQDFTRMPSRQTAEPSERQGRAQILNQATQQGYIHNAQVIRISQTGRRFKIEDVELWDVLNQQGQRCGQAARFSQWQWLPPKDLPTT